MKSIIKTIKENKLLLTMIFISIGLIIYALIVFFQLYFDFNKYSKEGLHFGEKTDISEFAQTIAGIIGSILTLSGIIALFITIHQTKQEMVETKKIMNNQLSESTFFNLLKHHSDISSNYKELLKGTQQGFVRDIKIYKESEEYREFTHFETSSLHPINLYNDLDVSIHNLIHNMLHIANFIDTKLIEKEFYHKTFELTLSEGELFLFGLVITHKLEGIKNINYQYDDFYISTTNFNNSIPKLPVLTTKNKLDYSIFVDESFKIIKSSLIDAEGSLNYNIHRFNSCTLVCVEYCLIRENKNEPFIPIPNSEGKFNFIEFLNNNILGELQKTQYASTHELHLIYKIEYKNIIYCIHKHLDLRIHKHSNSSVILNPNVIKLKKLILEAGTSQIYEIRISDKPYTGNNYN